MAKSKEEQKVDSRISSRNGRRRKEIVKDAEKRGLDASEVVIPDYCKKKTRKGVKIQGKLCHLSEEEKLARNRERDKIRKQRKREDARRKREAEEAAARRKREAEEADGAPPPKKAKTSNKTKVATSASSASKTASDTKGTATASAAAISQAVQPSVPPGMYQITVWKNKGTIVPFRCANGDPWVYIEDFDDGLIVYPLEPSVIDRASVAEMAGSLLPSNIYKGIANYDPTQGVTNSQKLNFLAEEKWNLNIPVVFGKPKSGDTWIGNCPCCMKVGLCLHECSRCKTMVRPLTNLYNELIDPFVISMLWGFYGDDLVTPVKKANRKLREDAGLYHADGSPNEDAIPAIMRSPRRKVREKHDSGDSIQSLVSGLRSGLYYARWDKICGRYKSLLFMLLMRSDKLWEEWADKSWDVETVETARLKDDDSTRDDDSNRREPESSDSSDSSDDDKTVAMSEC